MKNITIQIRTGEALFDAANRSYLAARMADAETKHEEFEVAALMFASRDSENLELLRRALTTHFATLVADMGEFVDIKASGSWSLEDHNAIMQAVQAGEALELVLSLPDNYNESGNVAVAKSIHNYLVEMMLNEWWRLRRPERAPEHIKAAALELSAIRAALRRRSRPAKIKRPPDGQQGGGVTVIELSFSHQAGKQQVSFNISGPWVATIQ